MNEVLSKIFLEGEAPTPPKPRKQRRYPRRTWLPKEGYAWNPIFQHMERNELCLCNSGQKWKKCCMMTQPRVVSQNVADHMILKIEAMKARNDGPERSIDAPRNKGE